MKRPSIGLAVWPEDMFQELVNLLVRLLGGSMPFPVGHGHTVLGAQESIDRDDVVQGLPAFGSCHQVLDIYHAAEHVADAGKGLYGEGTPEAAAWLERGRGPTAGPGCATTLGPRWRRPPSWQATRRWAS
ncbi:hypothetical protein BH23PLA1_BH23PLA1_31230 [soil metagenome]